MRFSISLILAVAAALAATAPGAAARARCAGVADGIAANDVVRLYETRTGAVRACWRATGRSTQLTTRGQRFRLGELSGRHIAYSVFENDAFIYLSVRRMDVRAGRLRVDVAATSAQAGTAEDDHGARVDEVRLARSGIAWAALNSRLGHIWEIGYVPGGTIRRDPSMLASSPTYEAQSLAVGRSHVYWATADGAPQRARY